MHPDFKGLIVAFRNKMVSSGMSVPLSPPNLFAELVNPNTDPNRKESLTIIRNILKSELQKSQGRKPSFILVLLENIDQYIYPGIKVRQLFLSFALLILSAYRRYGTWDSHRSHASQQSYDGAKETGSVSIECRIEGKCKARWNQSSGKTPCIA
jgi:hypothetical protein